MEPSDVLKTAITILFGLFEFVHMPFGLCNAAQTFQQFMDQDIRRIHFAYAYIDKASVSEEDHHHHHLQQVFDHFIMNSDKC